MASTKFIRKAAAFLALSLASYAAVIRPKLLRWGATDEETKAPFPGADLIPGGKRSSTMAVTIDAPPSAVWPWLVQMGYGRAGWYSWDALDNFGRHSADRIHPEWLNIKVGDMLSGPDVTPLEKNAWQVAMLEPQQFLGLRASFGKPHLFSDSLWGFWLKPLPEHKTRLIVSGYWRLEPQWLLPFVSFTAFEWTHWIMQTRQFTNLKRRVAPMHA